MERKSLNKKGNIGIVMTFAIIIMFIIFAAFFITIGSGVAIYVTDQIDTNTADMGMVHNTNMTHVQDITIGTLNTFVTKLNWLTGIVVALLFIGILLFAYYVRSSPSNFLIGAYLLLAVLLVTTSIFMSNIYEDIYSGTDVLSVQLQSMTMASFLIIHMPLIITAMIFIGGIILFSGINQEEYY